MAEPLLRLHYLGHSSFVLDFANGRSVLTDFGNSNSYGLDSPIYELGALRPDVVLFSHHDPDHDRGESFPGATILDGPHLHEEVGIDGIAFEPIRSTENAEGDNTSFLIRFEGLTILFSGDCQGDIAAIEQPPRRARIESIFPAETDLLLAPIDWTRTIAKEAVAFVELLRPKRLVPMHYWSPQAKAGFLSLLEEKNSRGPKRYEIEELMRPDYSINGVRPQGNAMKVISLEPAPYPG